MTVADKHIIRPRKIRLDASTVCQLKCPACPTAGGATGRRIGVGFLKFEDFKKFVNDNPRVAHIELSNWGEVLLNKDLDKILKYAYERSVALSSRNGNNFNDASPKILEAIVKYKLRVMTCSIDGTNQDTYAVYRVGGNFNRVMENVRMINVFKAKYRSRFPQLRWQFIAFGHNEHEISRARAMAAGLNMDFVVKHSWEDLFTAPFSPIKDAALVRRESGLGVADRGEYRRKYKAEFVKQCCLEMWKSPQINFDGRVLGCSINFWGDYGNAYRDGLENALNNDQIAYARRMLTGTAPANPGVPCTDCKIYINMREHGTWMSDQDIKEYFVDPRWMVFLENRYYVIYRLVRRGLLFLGSARRIWRKVYARRGDPRAMIRAVASTWFPPARLKLPRMKNRVYRLALPLAEDRVTGWRPTNIMRGYSRGLHKMTCHASSLLAQKCPHPPHHHKEEELLLMLSGEADLILPQDLAPGERQRRRLKKGEFVYYPSHFAHTLEAAGETTANYLMLKWYAPPLNHENILSFGHYPLMSAGGQTQGQKKFQTHLIFEGPTSCLKKLHAHATVLQPGAGYAPHADPYDVAIVVLEGDVETLGRRAAAHDAIIYPAGRPHGMRNPTNKLAKYIVFEFHGRRLG